MNIPNFITMIRILLVPLLVIFLIEDKNLYAFLTFVAAGVSDGLDGFLARILKQKTALGAFVDPIADKLLLTASYITMAILKLLPEWLAVLVVSRDFIILLGIGILMVNNRQFSIKPTIDSKMTTFIQLATICYFLAHDYLIRIVGIDFSTSLVYSTAFLTLLSGGHYIVIGFRILGRPDEEVEKASRE